MIMREFEKFLGSIFGLAIGDALGYPTEFLSREDILKKYGEKGVQGFESSKRHPAGTYTDDTQQSLAIAEGLIRSGGDDVDEVMSNVVPELVKWKNSPDNDRAPGRTSMAGLGGDTCGTSMRSAPIGLLYHNNPAKLREIAEACSVCTHGDDSATAAGIATAYLTSMALRGVDFTVPRDKVRKNLRRVDPSIYINKLLEFVGNLSPRFNGKIRKVTDVLHEKPDEAFIRLGDGWKADEAIAGSLYSLFNQGMNYKTAVLLAANSNGDSDSLASITGAICGAYHGLQTIPEEWVRGIENKRGLFDVAKRLYLKSVEMHYPNTQVEFLRDIQEGSLREISEDHDALSKLQSRKIQASFPRCHTLDSSNGQVHIFENREGMVRLNSYINEESKINFYYIERLNYDIKSNN
jgi:ADP-ribosylglycohydrolase